VPTIPIYLFPATDSAKELLEESNVLKQKANDVFVKGLYDDAVESYEKALSVCPYYLAYERAVLKSNIAACHLKSEKWKEAVKAADQAEDLLDEAEGIKKEKKQLDSNEDKNKKLKDGGDGDEKPGQKIEVEEDEEADEEIISAGAKKAAPPETVKNKLEIDRIRTKVLLRRGKARMQIGSWASLTGATEDYQLLSKMSNLTPGDRKVVKAALIVLPSRTKAAQESEMGEMMGKLKDVS
jgi:tetratricopeptide (TPR) repeat protein